MFEPFHEWEEQALCAQTDPNVFFLDKGESSGEAKRICNLCEVKDECLDLALRTRQPFGIWGGKTARERRKMLEMYVCYLEGCEQEFKRDPGGRRKYCSVECKKKAQTLIHRQWKAENKWKYRKAA